MKNFLVAFSILSYSIINAQQLPPGFTQIKIAEGLDPTRMVLADDGRIFIAEKYGAVRIVKDGVLMDTPLISIPVDNVGERGLEGIVLDPDFGTNQYFYVYYTVPEKKYNRVSRFKASGDYADLNSELILIELDNLWFQIHNGGAMVFGNDNKLYIASGDGYNPDGAQSFTNTLGKVLRINSDGSIPEDNPFFNSTTGKFRAIYSLGFRNPFSMAIEPQTGKILINDVGNASYEEINILSAGKNYGWPQIEGFLLEQTPPDNYQDPLYAYDHNEGCAIVGASFYNPSSYVFPEKYHNQFFFGDFCSGKIKVLNPETGNIIETFATNVNEPVDILTAPDGSMYYFSRGSIGGDPQESTYSSKNGKLWRIQYTGSGAPFIFKQPKSQLLVVGETASFYVSASGSEPLSYQWLKDGVEIENATEDTLAILGISLDDSASVFTCKVINTEGEILSDDAILSVTDNARPEIFITFPAGDYFYQAADTIIFKGNATDEEDGPIPKESLTWQIDFHHNDHVHPGLTPVSGIDSAGFVLPSGGETASNVWYRIYLTAIDSDGLSKRIYKDVYPKKSSLTIKTGPAGLTITLDGQPVPTPNTFESVVNLSRTFYAPPVIYDQNNAYLFQKWSGDVTTNLLQLNTPDVDSTFIAFYSIIPLADGSGLTAHLFNQSRTFEPPADFVRVDSTINFYWGIDSPQPDSIQKNDFTILWTGYLKAPLEDEYTFHLIADNGARLWIDNQLIIDCWTGGIEKTGTLYMIPDHFYKIRIEYYDEYGFASIKLYWSSTAIGKSIIPKNQFFLINPDNTSPDVSFTEPHESFKFIANEEITVKALAYDNEDGEYDPKNILWRVDLHDGDHVHSVIPETTSLDSITFLATIEGHSSLEIWYRVYATAVDQDGFATTISRDIYPVVVSVNLNSNIQDIVFTWDNLFLTSPVTLQQIGGTIHSVSVPEELTIQNYKLKFEKWDGNNISNTISFFIPGTDSTLTAIYEIITGSVKELSEIKIYPNPFIDTFVIKRADNLKIPIAYEIINTLGETVISWHVLEDTESVNLANQSSGIYFLKVMQANTLRFIKILKL